MSHFKNRGGVVFNCFNKDDKAVKARVESGELIPCGNVEEVKVQEVVVEDLHVGDEPSSEEPEAVDTSQDETSEANPTG